MMKKLGLVVLALMLVLVACGGDDAAGQSAEEQAKAAEIKAELLADTSATNPFADEAAATCFADGIVGEFGVERINALDTGSGLEAGMANMTTEEQTKMADLALGCIDFQQVIKDQMAASGLPEETANCVADGLNEDMLRGLFLTQASGGDPSQNAELLQVVMDCLTP
jgi:protein involved in sex pheromone biosynthesis